MQKPLSLLGSTIKKVRRERRLTLQELAGKIGITAGMLSKIENFRTIPSLPVLFAVAAALEINLSELFKGVRFDAQEKWLLVHPSERRKIEREENRNLEYEMILESPVPAGGSMQLMFVRIPHGSGGAEVTTEADELLYILDGNFQYRIDGKSVALAPGDCLWFDGRLPHVPENSGAPGSLLAFYFFRESEL